MLINRNSTFFHNRQKKILAIFFRILQLCTCPFSYDSDLGPFCSRQLRGLPSSDGYFSWFGIGLITHILEGYFTGTGAIIWLPQCQWSNPEGHGVIISHQATLTDDINTMWQNKTMYIYYMGYIPHDMVVPNGGHRTVYIPLCWLWPTVSIKNKIICCSPGGMIGVMISEIPVCVWAVWREVVSIFVHLLHYIKSGFGM